MAGATAAVKVVVVLVTMLAHVVAVRAVSVSATTTTAYTIADELRRFKWDNKALNQDIPSSDLLNMATMAVEDLANGGPGKLAGVPLVAMQSLSRHLGRLVPQTPTFFASPAGPVPSSTTVKRAGLYALALSPASCATTPAAGDTHTAALCNGTLPSATDVWARLLNRTGPYTPEERLPVSFLIVSFVDWLHADTFRTVPGTSGSLQWLPKDPISLAQVYGDTPQRQAALRTFAGGKMKTSTAANGETLPPRYLDILADFPTFTMQANVTGQPAADPATLFAFGDPRFNMHPGHLFWGTFALRTHNHLCDLVAAERPTVSDEVVYQTARLLLLHLVMKIRLENFISDIAAPFREAGRLAYVPDGLRLLPEFKTDFAYVWHEFNQLYRGFHALLPDALTLANGSAVPIAQTLFRPGTFNVSSEGLAPLAGALHRTRMGKFGARSVPAFMQYATVGAILDNRAQRLRSFNDYREYFKLPRLTTFEQFGMDADTTDAMRQLYRTPDNVDFFVGVMCETGGAITNNIFGDLQLVLLALFEIQDIASLDIVRLPELWTANVLTASGKAYVQAFSLAGYLSSVLNATVQCPFLTDDEDCTAESAFAQPGSMALSGSNLCDFCGTDYYADWFYESTGFYALTIALIFVSCNIGVIFVYMGSYLVARHFILRSMARAAPGTAASSPSADSSVNALSEDPLWAGANNGGIKATATEEGLAMTTLSSSVLSTGTSLAPSTGGGSGWSNGSSGALEVEAGSALEDAAPAPPPKDIILPPVPPPKDSAPPPVYDTPTTATKTAKAKAKDAAAALAAGAGAGTDKAHATDDKGNDKAAKPAGRRHHHGPIIPKTRLILATSTTASAVLTTALSGLAGWVFMRIVFSDSLDAEMDTLTVPMLVCFGSLVALYTAEACVRVVARAKATLFIHHIITIVIFILEFATRSIWVLRLGCILACFAYWECPVLVAMMISRLQLVPDRATYRWVFPFCVILYVATRVAELVLLIMFFASSAERMAATGQTGMFVTLLLLSFVFMFMQFAILRPVYYTWLKHRTDKRD